MGVAAGGQDRAGAGVEELVGAHDIGAVDEDVLDLLLERRAQRRTATANAGDLLTTVDTIDE